MGKANKRTKIEYETKEVEVEGYDCEQCSKFVPSDDVVTVTFTSNDGDFEKHLCNECSGVNHALSVERKRLKLKDRVERYKRLIHPSVFLTGLFVGSLTMIFAGVTNKTGYDDVWVLEEPSVGFIVAIMVVGISLVVGWLINEVYYNE